MSGAPCLIGLPYDASSSFRRGPATGPPLIRAALHSDAGNAWTETGHDLIGPADPVTGMKLERLQFEQA